jgi:hypothetical protein
MALHVVGEALLAPVRYAIGEFVDSIWRVHLAYERAADCGPLSPNPIQLRAVEWHPAAFLLCDSPLEIRAQHCMRQRSDRWDDVLDQARECACIFLAVVQNLRAFVGAEWRALQDTIAHLALVRGVDAVFAKILQRSVEAEESLLAICSLGGAVVHVMTKLDVRIEGAGRPAPTERNVRSKLGADHVAHDQGIGVEPVRRERAELVLP